MREKTQAGIVGGVAVLLLSVLPAFGQIVVPNGDPTAAQHLTKKVL